jgi:hypothetical protein
MLQKYVMIQGSKKTARQKFIDGEFFTWTDENLKSAFSFCHGTIKDLQRFIKDNINNTTVIYTDSLKYVDTNKVSDIDRETLIDTFYKWHEL